MPDFLSRLAGLVMRLLPLLLMAIVAGSTFWLVQLNSPREADEASRAKRHEPDYWMERFSATELAEDGTTKLRFTGVKMVHFEDDQTYDVTTPAMRSYELDRPPVTVNAQRGTMNAEGSIIDLYGNAFVVRQAGTDPSKDPRMTAASQYFQLLVNDDIVKTDRAVQLTRGPSVMTANGMIFNNVTREVQLLGNVRGTIIMNSPQGQARTQ
ncbi:MULTISPECIES: LPS export ABC transporter periplasmic protein LptC [unclassified Cupriavidus]|uniref:LPS export ABC transporter periplasmic protein LptC n=1 Tax=unclassified Cupriavidus TaxID=2640874 RepID=UPI001C007310|nr:MULTISPECIES: LPS export ABC transporter periplasmic protein LptC [unclassified Cupriavidus]MCA3190388.1 LPS export ABC transporter periplasmic protein LptC [Cupriavidus sp.]MCA3197092.1 LPS export ABC transporter periplasmic protein LptC [Cupriavidus sp.]MCA3202369.1 LPS export ABC transporter periplasmic protein LptC [Cupriavidus sp.]MCA3205838.1 LPS export ABC transporter periplasmic protein LptC [Cupriavidus sp.]MCA3232997.1 LPS export ABC transporter periplasmic protein LptC [Cupriavid